MVQALERLGALNGHSVGRLLKETVRRAMVAIRRERTIFEAHTKESYAGTMDDVFTSADKAAQEIYLRAFAECFPDCGVIAEENAVHVPSKNGLYFTVDPIDGTKAFVRRQSHGVSTMVALASEEGEVLSAYIGDVNTWEIYGYRPGSDKVHRITDLESSEILNAKPEKRTMRQSYALLRDPPDAYGPESRRLMKQFKNYEVMGSSIGTWAARLWKGEVQGLLLTKGFETPWDSTPVIGISKKLGYRFFRPESTVEFFDGYDSSGWKPFDPKLPVKTYQRAHDVLITRLEK